MALDKADQDLLNDKNTIVIIPEVQPEYMIATKWLRQNAPKAISEQRVFTELSLSSLQTDIRIVTVARDFAEPVARQVVDAGGGLHYPNRPDAELLAEVDVSDPVQVSKFWVRDNPMRPGKPDTAGILEAINKASMPWIYEFVDKGEAKPDLLKLGKV